MMNGTEMAYTAAYLGLAAFIIGVFFYRIRRGTFRRHITAEKAIVICFVLVTLPVKELGFIVQLLGVAAVGGMFNYGRVKSKESD
jgi:Kef-type K+ transport system membrane component KefB